MFDGSGGRSQAEVIAGFDEMFAGAVVRTPTPDSRAWLQRVAAAVRVENQAAAAQLVAIGELFAYRLSQSAETEEWAIDTMEAVAAEVGAGLRISQAMADFVRCRDLTCRWPGCDVPAVRCDIDHTIPHAQGGPTHAGSATAVLIIW